MTDNIEVIVGESITVVVGPVSGPRGLKGNPGSGPGGGTGTGAVDSVNTKTGVVVLDATDVGADPSGAAQAAVTAHEGATDPHGDRDYADGLVSTEVTARDAAITAAVDALVAGAPGALDTLAELAAQLGDDESAVAALTTALSGKVDTDDGRLTDARTPMAHEVSHQSGGSDALSLDASQIGSGVLPVARYATGTPTGSKFVADDGSLKVPAGGASGPNPPPFARRVGSHYSAYGWAAYVALYTTGAVGRMSALPVWLHAGNLDQIGVHVQTVGSSTWRLGIYPSHPTTGMPDGSTLLVDAGTLDMSVASGNRFISMSATIPTAGVYWLMCVVDAYMSQPVTRAFYASNGVTNIPPALGAPTAPADSFSGGTWSCRRWISGITPGGLPATCPAAYDWTEGSPKLMVRAAA